MQRIIGGRYELSEELGSGAFGRVWRGRDRTLGAEVAVKEVWLGAASEAEQAQRVARAERESRHAAQLRGHPNVVAVHDVVVEDGKPWIVMDYVEGRTLAERIAETGPFPVEQVAEVARGLLSALSAAHEKGIVHRDVKPANVMVTDGGRVLLADFGIAQHSADTAITASNTLVGTLEYMPPERFNGVDSGPAGDLYSLGVTLYQAVEGFSPFHRETPTETLTAVVLGTPPQPERAGRLTPLLGALLAKDPAARPTAQGALAMLEGAAAGQSAPTMPVFPAPTPPAPAPGSATGRGRSGKSVAVIAGGAAVVVAAAVATAFAVGSGGGHDHPSAGGSTSSGSTSTPASSGSASTPAAGSTSTSPAAGGDTATTPASDSGTLTVWLQVDAQQLWPQAVTDATTVFERAHPSVKVKIEYQSWSVHLTKFTVADQAGMPPDVAEFGTQELPAIVTSGALKDVTADKSSFDNSSTWRAALVQPCTAGGKLYCVPYYAGERNGAVIGGSDLAIPATAPHADWSAEWIKDFTSTAVEHEIAKAGHASGSATTTIVANSTAIS